MTTWPPVLRAGDEVDVDVLVVGAGVAGLVTALEVVERAPGARVAVVDKGAIGTSGSTPLAQGGLAAAVGPDDSPERHAADTLRAGDGLCDALAVRVMAAAGPERVADLVRRGARFDRAPGGGFALAREGGQSVARSVRAADATGAEIFRVLRRGLVSARAGGASVERLQGRACALAQTASGAVVGAWVLADGVAASALGPEQEEGLVLVRARRTVLATGGCGGLYATTTNRSAATGDGVALAYAAGATVADMEFIQFHPTALADGAGGDGCLLLTEALRGAGATLVDRDGRRFLPEVHPDAELAPRHVVTKAILDQPGGVWLDATALPPQVLAEEFPTVVAGARRHGYDLAREPVPVRPAEHYMIGGVATDLDGRTSLPRLFAVGEVACTGVHGANRMAGNSLLQSCVFGARAAAAVAGDLAVDEDPLGDPDPPPVRGGTAPSGDLDGLRRTLRAAMDDGAGPVRDAAGLARATAALDRAEAALGAPTLDAAHVELRHLVTVARLIVRHARLRTESRGVHWRDDHPRRDPAWDGVRLRSAAVDVLARGAGRVD
ncbi:MAG TPA: FAD-binding protein [Egibacteraceae bacterium]